MLGQRGELQLVRRGARILVGQEPDGIGDPARLNAQALRCRVVQTAARFELGTIEYLSSLP